MTTTGDREVLHRLIDALRPEDVGTAQRVLEALNATDPLLMTLRNAPIDDESETDAEREATERARGELRDGKWGELSDRRRRAG